MQVYSLLTLYIYIYILFIYILLYIKFYWLFNKRSSVMLSIKIRGYEYLSGAMYEVGMHYGEVVGYIGIPENRDR